MLANFILSGQKAIKKEKLELHSMVITSLHYANGERKERNCLEMELAMAKGWIVLAQKSLSQVQVENEKLRGLRESDAQRFKLLEGECSSLSTALKDRECMLSAARVREKEALKELGVAQRRIITQDMVIKDLRSDLTLV